MQARSSRLHVDMGIVSIIYFLQERVSGIVQMIINGLRILKQ